MAFRLFLPTVALLAAAGSVHAFDHDSPASTTKAYCDALNEGDPATIQQFYSAESLSRYSDAPTDGNSLQRQELAITHGQKISEVKIVHVSRFGNVAQARVVVHYGSGGASVLQLTFVREGGDWKLLI